MERAVGIEGFGWVVSGFGARDEDRCRKEAFCGPYPMGQELIPSDIRLREKSDRRRPELPVRVRVLHWKRIIAVAALALMVSATVVAFWLVPPFVAYKRALAEIEKGDQYAKDSDHYTAIACYGKAIELQLDLVRAYIQRGKIYGSIWMLEHQKAVADFSKAIELEPDNAEAFYERGVEYYSNFRLKESAADLSQTIRLQPDYAKAYRYRGQSFLSLGDSTQALADASKSVELDPDDDMNWYYRALLHRQMGDYDQAVADVTKAIEIKPSRDSYSRRAEYLMLLGRPKVAIEDLTEAIKLSPKSWHLYRERASAYRQAGDTTQADKDEQLAVAKEKQESPKQRAYREYVKQAKEAARKNKEIRDKNQDKEGWYYDWPE